MASFKICDGKHFIYLTRLYLINGLVLFFELTHSREELLSDVATEKKNICLQNYEKILVAFSKIITVFCMLIGHGEI